MTALFTPPSVSISSAHNLALNPFATGGQAEIASLLLHICGEDRTENERSDLKDAIDALVPALIELRDGGHLDLNAAKIIEYGRLDGFEKLAGDGRVTASARAKCAAICDRARTMTQIFLF